MNDREKEAGSAEFCRFPDCLCPLDPGPEPEWCAKGLPWEDRTMADFKLFHVDDCMYVAAADEAAARAHVQADCGPDCGESIQEASLGMSVTTANVDDGEKATPDTMTTAQALIEDHIAHGGSLPYTVCFDAGM